MARLAYYKLATDGSDTEGGSALTLVGSVPFSTVGGLLCSGPYSTLNRWTTPAAFNVALAGLAAYRIQFYAYLNSLTNWVAFSSNDANCFMQFQPDGSIRWGTAAAGDIVASAAGSIVTGAWYKCGFNFDGTNKSIDINEVQATSEVKNGSMAALTTGHIGSYQGSSLPIDGYIRQFKLYSPTLPVDITGDSSDAAVAGSWPTNFFRHRGRR